MGRTDIEYKYEKYLLNHTKNLRAEGLRWSGSGWDIETHNIFILTFPDFYFKMIKKSV